MARKRNSMGDSKATTKKTRMNKNAMETSPISKDFDLNKSSDNPLKDMKSGDDVIRQFAVA